MRGGSTLQEVYWHSVIFYLSILPWYWVSSSMKQPRQHIDASTPSQGSSTNRVRFHFISIHMFQPKNYPVYSQFFLGYLNLPFWKCWNSKRLESDETDLPESYNAFSVFHWAVQTLDRAGQQSGHANWSASFIFHPRYFASQIWGLRRPAVGGVQMRHTRTESGKAPMAVWIIHAFHLSMFLLARTRINGRNSNANSCMHMFFFSKGPCMQMLNVGVLTPLSFL
jgi:hypothetical protein